MTYFCKSEYFVTVFKELEEGDDGLEIAFAVSQAGCGGTDF